MNRVSIVAIAERAGVSVATVHRALHNDKGVSENTRQRVLNTAARLGYRPNRIAQGLRSHRTLTIGVVLTGISSSYYARILEGIEMAATEAGYSILLSSSQDDSAKERRHIELLLEQRVDGIIIAPTDPEGARSYYEQLLAEGVRLVLLGRYIPGLAVSSVETNNWLGGYIAGAHLRELGRKQVGIVTTIAPKRQYSYVTERIQGCMSALAEAGVKAPVIIGQDIQGVRSLPEFGYDAMRQFVQMGGIVDGVFAINDDLAYGVIGALLDVGLRIPEDVAVVGFNDESMSAFYRPSVSTVRSPLHQIGAEAVRMVVALIERGTPAESVKRVLIEPVLVVRESSGGSVRQEQQPSTAPERRTTS